MLKHYKDMDAGKLLDLAMHKIPAGEPDEMTCQPVLLMTLQMMQKGTDEQEQAPLSLLRQALPFVSSVAQSAPELVVMEVDGQKLSLDAVAKAVLLKPVCSNLKAILEPYDISQAEPSDMLGRAKLLVEMQKAINKINADMALSRSPGGR